MFGFGFPKIRSGSKEDLAILGVTVGCTQAIPISFMCADVTVVISLFP